mmetsp:Transcript_12246/g.23240  ORF Transcript_12246/g.23240 Transcript_12246/m.23240 type:complete len:229 (-) Transcript_12246:1736-2422(-)
MSLSEASALRLLDAQRERIKAEKEAELLASRVKMLQNEELKLKKRTEDQLKEQQRLEAARKRNQERNQHKAALNAERSRKVQEAKQVIELLKERHERERGRMQEAVWKIRQDAGREGREIRAMSLNHRKQTQEAIRLENYKKSEQIRREKEAKTRKLESLRTTQLDTFREDYLKRVSEEEEKLSHVNRTMLQLEELEARLIEKLKDSLDRSSRVTARSHLLDRSSPIA